MTTVLILDDDLGFILWLGQVLGTAGYVALPAPSVSDAVRLIRTFQLTTNLLIVNPTLSGTAEFIDECRRQPEPLRVMVIVDRAAGSKAVINRADFVKRKPREDDPSSSEWLEAIARALDSGVVNG